MKATLSLALRALALVSAISAAMTQTCRGGEPVSDGYFQMHDDGFYYHTYSLYRSVDEAEAICAKDGARLAKGDTQQSYGEIFDVAREKNLFCPNIPTFLMSNVTFSSLG